MNQTIKVKRAEVKDIIERTFPDYKGRTFSVEAATKVTFHDTNWGGGSRNYYRAVTASGQVGSLPNAAPWDNPVEGKTVDLPAGVVVVRHAIFCGHDIGITIYANPADMPKWINSGKEN